MTDTPVEESLFQIIHCYHEYAAREGDAETLSLEELKALLTDNVPRFMETLLPMSCGCARTPEPALEDSLGKRSSLGRGLRGGKPDVPAPGRRPPVSQGRKEPYYITQLFRAADKNQDNQICFEEFLYILGKLVKDYHLQYHRQLCAHYCTQHSLY
ncbi:protein S100-A15A isoform X1 [Bos javanicus]|uniref:protein S100-A15A isoform X1 n=1 Tax=Bos javanicus TaxID=9906 RepID=UPI002AA64479|nr:protein S100-A15A isoform X1 [Bos javanicus]XP_061261890.1 protein S100-A15A isoform X1 [Bos javanicus]XP_061261897.1 protein S100-A15A isoform X1 [Bos javanicus]